MSDTKRDWTTEEGLTEILRRSKMSRFSDAAAHIKLAVLASKAVPQLVARIRELETKLHHPDLLDAMHELLNVDACMEERVEAAEKLAAVIGHQWPPYPNSCPVDCEKDHDHE